MDAELNTSPFKTRNDGSDTDFQANAIDSDAGDDSTPAEETDRNPQEDMGPNVAAPRQPKQAKQAKIKGEAPSVRPQSTPV